MDGNLLNLLPSPGGPDAHATPSVFEIALEKKLVNALKPAFDFAFGRVFETSQLSSFNNEAFALLSLLIHRRSLTSRGAMLMEFLYGMRRQCKDAEWSPSAVRLALIVEILIPYIKAKLDALYLREQEDDLLRAPVQRSQFGVRCRRCFAALFPFVHAAYELSFVGYLLAYAVGSSQYSSPLLHLARQTLTRQAVPGSSLPDAPVSPTGTPGAATQAPPTGTRKWLGAFVRYGFIGTLVLFKLLEWWYAPPAEQGMYSQPQGAVPPPPLKPRTRNSRSRYRMPANLKLCPICRHPRVNTTASTAGILYCYVCVYEAVVASPYCPVTGVPCAPGSLRKLYETSS